MTKISVVIPVYNVEKYLRRCLDSVCKQTLKSIEVICVNDCSSDNSLTILNEYAENDSRIKVIDLKNNIGAGAARNAGIKASNSEYIGFLDSDDWVDLNFYEKLYGKAISSKSEMVKSNLKIVNKDIIDLNFVYNNIEDVKLNKINFNHVPTAIYKKDFLNQFNIMYPEDIKILEDTIFEIKTSFYANSIELVDDVFYYYYTREDSANNEEVFNTEKIDEVVASFNRYIETINLLDLRVSDYIISFVTRYSSLLYFILEKLNNQEDKDFWLSSMKQLCSKTKYEECIELVKTGDKTLDIKKDMVKKVRSNMNKIPKKIFYVWVGGNKPNLVNICIENWKDKLPDYELIEVNEKSPYFDFGKAYSECKWFKTIYDKKMWAYVSDYIRCKVLYDHGGVYLDTDVTLYKDITPLLEGEQMFIGKEDQKYISVGIFGVVKNHPFLKDMIDFYHNEIFDSTLYTIPSIMTEVYSRKYYDIKVYNPEYFYPYHYSEKFTPECIKEHTYCVHWWNVSWDNDRVWLKNKHTLSKLKRGNENA